MKDNNSVYIAYGTLHAETIRQFLRSFEIDAEISQESVGSTLGLTVGTLGKVAILVPPDQKERALEILHRMEMGEFIEDGESSTSSDAEES